MNVNCVVHAYVVLDVMPSLPLLPNDCHFSDCCVDTWFHAYFCILISLLVPSFAHYSFECRLPDEENLTADEYKSKHRKRLEEEGYRIKSCLGDQWSDCSGESAGKRTFKLPNPMYYIY